MRVIREKLGQHLAPGQGGERAVVWTHHGERRTNRIFVFLKNVFKNLIFHKNHQKARKRSQTLPATHLQVCQGHLRAAELAGGFSVFAFPAQVVGNLLPHHPLLTLSQRAGNLEERTHVQVVLQTHR